MGTIKWSQFKATVQAGDYPASNVEVTAYRSADGRFEIKPRGKMATARTHGAHGQRTKRWMWTGFSWSDSAPPSWPGQRRGGSETSVRGCMRAAERQLERETKKKGQTEMKRSTNPGVLAERVRAILKEEGLLTEGVLTPPEKEIYATLSRLITKTGGKVGDVEQDLKEYQWLIELGNDPPDYPEYEEWRDKVEQEVEDWISRSKLKGKLYVMEYSHKDGGILVHLTHPEGYNWMTQEIRRNMSPKQMVRFIYDIMQVDKDIEAAAEVLTMWRGR